jgi:hypothetical protein
VFSEPITTQGRLEHPQHQHLLLQGLVDPPDGLDAVEGPGAGDVGLAAQPHPLAGLVAHDLADGRGQGLEQAAALGRHLLGHGVQDQLGPRQPLGGQPLVELSPQRLQVLGGHVLGRLDQPLLDPPGVDDQHQHDHPAPQPDDLDVPQPRPVEGRRGHHGRVVGQAGQQQRGPLQGLLEVGRPLEEAGDGLPRSVGIRPALVWGCDR